MSPTGTASRVVKTTLKQETVERLIHEKLASSFTVIKSFRIIRLGSSEDDKSNVITSVAGATAVVFAVKNVEGVARSQSRATIISFGITHS